MWFILWRSDIVQIVRAYNLYAKFWINKICKFEILQKLKKNRFHTEIPISITYNNISTIYNQVALDAETQISLQAASALAEVFACC